MGNLGEYWRNIAVFPVLLCIFASLKVWKTSVLSTQDSQDTDVLEGKDKENTVKRPAS